MSDTGSDTGRDRETPREAPADHDALPASSSQARPHDVAASRGSSSNRQAAGSSTRPFVSTIRSDQEERTVISGRTPAAAAEAARVDPHVGQLLDHFELEALVGRGGMGTVYRARDTKLGRTVAVKVLSPDSGCDEELLARFKNEAQSAARLEHENVARVFHVGECGGVHYIVYEFIEGTNIRDLVTTKGPLPVADAVSYTLQIAETLAHAFERDVVHRDIKPSNILITASGQVKVVDLGLARLHQVEQSGDDLTASGVTLGTFDYISPEQAGDPRSADVRSDLYSLGCTLYFMLAGRPPFPDGTALKKLLQHAQVVPADPREFRDDVPAELARIVAKLLAKSPGDRYPHPRELIGDLLMFAQQSGLRTGKGAAVWPAERSRREAAWERHIPWAIPVALLIAFVWFLAHFGNPGDVPQIDPPRAARAASSPKSEGEKPAPRRQDESNAIDPDESPFDWDEEDWPEDSGPPKRSDDSSEPGTKRTAATDKKKPTNSKIEKDADPIESNPAFTGRRTDSGTGDEGAGSARAASGSRNDASAAAAGQNTDISRSSADASKTVDPPAVPPGTVVQVVRESVRGDAEAVISLERAFATALADAKRQGLSQVRIDLRYNGVQELRPAVIDGLNVQFAAAPGFAPTILFHPASNDPDESPRSMFRLVGGQLTLDGVHLVLRLPRHPAERWSLFDLHEAEKLKLSGCTMTIENAAASGAPLHQHVAFIDVRGRRDVSGMMMPEGERAPPLLAIRLDDCVARGEATLLRTQSVQAVRLTWNNGLLATSERLLACEGTAMPPAVGNQLKLTLSHVTAAVGRGLAMMANAQHTPYQLVAEIESENCIFLGRGESPLVEQRGVDSIEDFKERLLMLGEKNFYEGFSVFWRVHGVGFESEPADMNFTEWRNHWAEAEKLPHPPGQVQWQQLPPATMAVSAQRPEHYALRASENNPARESAARARDAGARFDALPKLPVLREEDAALDEDTP